MAVADSVLEASAPLAYLGKEPGGERVLQTSPAGGTVMAAVNFGEVATWFVRHGADEVFVRGLRERLALPLVLIGDNLVVRAALLEPATRAFGPGLDSRTCLALAGRLGVPADTPDRPWAGSAARVGVAFDLIR